MARGVPGFVRIGAALAGCALIAACTPDAGPTQTPTPTAPGSSVSPTPSATPTETEIERQQRADFQAAETAYRTAIAESDRIARNGGANNATQELRAVATGDYLETQINSLKFLKSRGWRVSGSITILGVKPLGGWSARDLELLACEDNSTWKMLDSKGKDVTPTGDIDYIQTLTVKKVRGAWKVSTSQTKEVQQVSVKDCQP